MLAFMLGGFVLAYADVARMLGIWGFILLMSAWLGAVLITAFGLRLRCPACRKRLEPAKGAYCPQCGSDQFRLPRTADPYCPSCDCLISEGDGDSCRNYRIRGCTHCGVMLDEIGV
jgi:hypothetical protein